MKMPQQMPPCCPPGTLVLKSAILYPDLLRVPLGLDTPQGPPSLWFWGEGRPALPHSEAKAWSGKLGRLADGQRPHAAEGDGPPFAFELWARTPGRAGRRLLGWCVSGSGEVMVRREELRRWEVDETITFDACKSPVMELSPKF